LKCQVAHRLMLIATRALLFSCLSQRLLARSASGSQLGASNKEGLRQAPRNGTDRNCQPVCEPQVGLCFSWAPHALVSVGRTGQDIPRLWGSPALIFGGRLCMDLVLLCTSGTAAEVRSWGRLVSELEGAFSAPCCSSSPLGGRAACAGASSDASPFFSWGSFWAEDAPGIAGS